MMNTRAPKSVTAVGEERILQVGEAEAPAYSGLGEGFSPLEMMAVIAEGQ
jgi:hypothetical protein